MIDGYLFRSQILKIYSFVKPLRMYDINALNHRLKDSQQKRVQFIYMVQNINSKK